MSVRFAIVQIPPVSGHAGSGQTVQNIRKARPAKMHAHLAKAGKPTASPPKKEETETASDATGGSMVGAAFL